MDIDKFKLFEKIKISYLKHRRNSLAVAEELGLEVDYVKRVGKKIEGKERKDVNVLMANSLLQCVLEGYESRVAYRMEMLRSLQDRAQVYKSLCCNLPVKKVKEEKESYFQCMKCNERTEVVMMDRLEIFELKEKILVGLREEDTALMAFAEKMGYTTQEKLPDTILKSQQNILVLGKEGITAGQQQVLGDLSLLSPMDREKIIKRLEAKILDDSKKEGQSSGEKEGR